MNAVRNLVHGVVLLGWVGLGLCFSLNALFASGDTPFLTSFFGITQYWLWLGGLAAVTTWLVRRIESGVGALLVHAGVFTLLMALPAAFPVNLLRLGLDVLQRA